MMDELMESIEESFVERYFDYGNDVDTSMSNLKASLNVYFKANKECLVFAEQISDGEVVDISSVVLALNNLILAHKYEEQFKKALGGCGPMIDITKIAINKPTELLAGEGTALVAGAEKSHNIDNLEKGKYLLFAAMLA